MNIPDKPAGNRPDPIDSPRISRDEAAIRTAAIWALRSTCLRKKVGAVILGPTGRVLSTGYAGAPKGEAHCIDVGCLTDPITGGCTRTRHAEDNAIRDAIDRGIDLSWSTIYCTISPCLTCAQMIRDAGITQVVYYGDYRDRSGLDLLLAAADRIDTWKFSDHYGILLPDLEAIK
jgi:dCMP deaminase